MQSFNFFFYIPFILDFWPPILQKWKYGLETQVVFVDILNYLEWSYRENIKTVNSGSFCEELLSENDFEAALVNFCCYDYGTNASEAVTEVVCQLTLKQLIL